jgi:hypothetical protein
LKDSAILSANLRALRECAPGLAESLAQHTPDPSRIQIFPTKDDVSTIQYQHMNGDRTVQTFLHSRYHPLTEATRFAEANGGDAPVLLYGFGLGYHVQAMAERLAPGRQLHIIEANPDILKTAFSLMDFTELIENPQVELSGATEEDDICNLIEALRQKGFSLAIHKPSMNCLSESFGELKLRLTNYLMPGTREARQDLAARNHFANIQIPSRPIYDLFETHTGETAVIVSSGPSLNTFWEFLRDHRPHLRLLCVGSALKFLVNQQITPDYVVLMDALHAVRNQLTGCEHLEVPLLYSNFTFAQAVEVYRGPKYLYLGEATPGFPDAQVLSIGGSVAVAALEIALKMGMRRVIFIGQDLCFAGGRHHASGTWLGTNTQSPDLANMIRVKNIRGEWVSTRPKLLNYRNSLAEKISTHPDVEFYNLADAGLDIHGATIASPDALAEIIQGSLKSLSK